MNSLLWWVNRQAKKKKEQMKRGGVTCGIVHEGQEDSIVVFGEVGCAASRRRDHWRCVGLAVGLGMGGDSS